MLRGWLFFQKLESSNYVLNYHNDAYNLEADMHDFHYFCVVIAARVTYLCEQYNIPKRTDGSTII